ncbi:tetratricopeptide repeat protein [Nannocystaceae bacterium ST9]
MTKPADPTIVQHDATAATLAAASDRVSPSADLEVTEGSGTRERDGEGRRTPDRLGRYLIVDQLGEGGMGVVYRAYDPELDRKVAIKLLRGQTSALARSRLLREAQAMAKLSHANVVPVFDVGTWEDQVFVAMDYVPGSTLRAWLDAEPRDWRSVVEVFVAAGRGLAAAHAQGIVHRDFKPDNVLVSEPSTPAGERRVLVLDFGLAKGIAGDDARSEEVDPDATHEHEGASELADSGPSRARTGGASRLSEQLTREGAVIGTPAYMAPEQHRGRATDARTDQFAFCVALFEGLWGRRPFAGTTYKALAFNVITHQVIPPPAESKLPARLWPLIARGLAGEPEQRWPDMASLLAALSDDPSQRRRTRLLFGGALLAFASTLAWGLLRSPEPPAIVEAPAKCTGASAALAEVWNPERAQAIATTFAARSESWAPDVAAEIDRRLGEWTERWTSGRTGACEATEVRGEQSAELMDLRIACYDRKLRELAPVVELLASADDQVARKAVDVVASLPQLDGCDDAEGLRAQVPPPADPAIAKQVDDVRIGQAEARSLSSAGRFDRALEKLEPLVPLAEQTGYAPLRFDVLRQHGRLLDKTGKPEQARALLEQAAFGSLGLRDDDVALDAIEGLIFNVGYDAADYEAGMRWAKLGEALLARQHEPSPSHRASLVQQIGMVEFQAGHFDAARSRIDEALQLDSARLGAEHPKLANGLDVLGAIELRTGNYQQAATLFRRSLAIVEKARGRTHPDLAPPLNNLALAHERLAEFDQSAAMFARVLDLLITAHGPEHPNVGLIEMNLGGVLLLAGKPDEAGPHLEAAVTTLEKALGSDHPLVGRALTMRGDWELETGKLELALASYQRSLAIRRAALGDDHIDLSLSHLGLGKALLANGREREAIRELERAVVMLTTGEGSDPIDRGLARFALAQALAAGGERARVPELLTAAREDFAAGGIRAAADLAKLEAWAKADAGE